MPLSILTKGSRATTPPVVDGLDVLRVEDPRAMAEIQHRAVDEMTARMQSDHRAYSASLRGQTAAFGWVATASADIGELALRFDLPAGNRYLWNFVTLERFRGMGIYPGLLRGIVEAESREAEVFWIAHAPENHASGAGIRKAGFTPAAELSFDESGTAAIRLLSAEHAHLTRRLIGVRESDEELALCWRCVRAGRRMSCASGSCSCDYQRPASGCAA
jgi:hypothetical protein